MYFILNILLLHFSVSICSFENSTMNTNLLDVDVDESIIVESKNEPKIITPLLVHGIPNNIIQDYVKIPSMLEANDSSVRTYGGFFTVNRKSFSNLYFWFCQSENSMNDPLVLWLQGGPGDTFFSSVFNGNGPYQISSGRIEKSITSWTSHFNMLYIENPVGAGYSFTKLSDGYSETVEEAASNIHLTLLQFFCVFNQFKNNDIYIAGESYGGKFAPVVAAYLLRENKRISKSLNDMTFNVKGVFIGSAFVDPVNQLYHADYFHQLGIVDEKTRDKIANIESEIRCDLKNDKLFSALIKLTRLVWISSKLGHFPPVDAVHIKMDNVFYDTVKKLIQSERFRSIAHIGDSKLHGKSIIWWYFRKDILKSVDHYISEIMCEIKVLFYAGQFDMLVPPTQIEKVIKNLNHSHAEKLYSAPREIWKVNEEIAGYVKNYENLYSVVVRKSNHFILHSQPYWIKELFLNFVRDDFKKN